jgi:hypothetical protein
MHHTSRLRALTCCRLGVLLALASEAVGCGSAENDAAESLPDTQLTAPTSAAESAATTPLESAAPAEPAAAGVPKSESAPSNTAPDQPVYEVPVASDDLRPFASFGVDEVNWRVTGDRIELDYDFPATLSGRSGQHIALSGQRVAPGHAQLSGEAGSADCTLFANLVRCAEKLPGLEIDSALARRMLSDLPEVEQELRGRVIESFSADPIGILSFAPGGRGQESDGEH